MKSLFLILLLFVGICSLRSFEYCVNFYIGKQKNTIISNIKNNVPEKNNMIITQIYNDVLMCAYDTTLVNGIIQGDTYRYIYRMIFQDEKTLTKIHKAYCNSGKEYGVKACSESFGENYPCSKLMDSFVACANDANYNDGL